MPSSERSGRSEAPLRRSTGEAKLVAATNSRRRPLPVVEAAALPPHSVNGSQKIPLAERVLQRKEKRAEQRAAGLYRVSPDNPANQANPTKRKKMGRVSVKRAAGGVAIPRPKSPETWVRRCRAYIRYVVRCLLRGHLPKHIPQWWRDDEMRIAAISAFA